jgi:integrase
MAQFLNDDLVADLPKPATGRQIEWDSAEPGFGMRVTAAGARSFVLRYRTRSGIDKTYTIGGFPSWKTATARREAGDLKAKIRANGLDPVGALSAEREAPTVARLAERFKQEHLPKLSESTQREYKSLIDNAIVPALKHRKVADVTFSDIDGLHRKLTRQGTRGRPTPRRANLMHSIVRKMLNQAIRWGWRADNPAKHVERNAEEKRRRYLSPEELRALTVALEKHADQQAANIIRLLLLTGARRGEVLALKWADLDLRAKVWTKPASATKQKALHAVPLTGPACLLLAELRKGAAGNAEYVFPGRAGPHRVEIKRAWRELCIDAGIVTTSSAKSAKGREIIVVKATARVPDAGQRARVRRQVRAWHGWKSIRRCSAAIAPAPRRSWSARAWLTRTST